MASLQEPGDAAPAGRLSDGRFIGTGVVDHLGRVFGYRNLFVIDGAIVPNADGPQSFSHDRRARRAHLR